jgi:hypothetical protein
MQPPIVVLDDLRGGEERVSKCRGKDNSREDSLGSDSDTVLPPENKKKMHS